MATYLSMTETLQLWRDCCEWWCQHLMVFKEFVQNECERHPWTAKREGDTPPLLHRIHVMLEKRTRPIFDITAAKKVRVNVGKKCNKNICTVKPSGRRGFVKLRDCTIAALLAFVADHTQTLSQALNFFQSSTNRAVVSEIDHIHDNERPHPLCIRHCHECQGRFVRVGKK